MGMSKYEGKDRDVLVCLCSLPRKILSMYERENITECVLHELCKESCFNWDKAAYFINNPDFDCLKGVAGYSKAESYVSEGSIWDNIDSFSVHMDSAPFNQLVRSVACKCCITCDGITHSELLDEIARELRFTQYDVYSWDLKYGNQGILLYQSVTDACSVISDEYVYNGVCFLGLCPAI
jgi:hypothetical protein